VWRSLFHIEPRGGGGGLVNLAQSTAGILVFFNLSSRSLALLSACSITSGSLKNDVEPTLWSNVAKDLGVPSFDEEAGSLLKPDFEAASEDESRSAGGAVDDDVGPVALDDPYDCDDGLR
jgi:hypothetical protein